MKPITESDKLEIRGRLFLWSNSLDSTSSYLRLYARNEAEIESHRPSQRQIEPEPRGYPTFSECAVIRASLQTAIVISFCTIFKRGGSDMGKVAENDSAFVKQHLDEGILPNLFSAEEILEFQIFRKACEMVRDKLIGHNDGPNFDMQHGSPITQFASSGFSTIDFDYLAKTCNPLSIAIMKYAEHMTG
jgi:hypothetical protein